MDRVRKLFPACIAALASLAASLAFALAISCAGQHSSSPLPAPDIEVSLDPAMLAAAPDTTAHFTVTVRPINGFTGTAVLSVDAPGVDVVSSVSPATLTLGTVPSTATISVRVPVWAATGDRALTLHVTGNFEPRDLPFKVNVLPAKLLPISTFVNFTQANLPFMAFKDGDSPWRLLEGNEGAYNAAVTDQAGRYGLAYGYDCAIGTFNSFQMNYIFQTMPESNSLGVYFICDPPPGPDPVLYSLQGRIQGQGTGSGYLVTSAAALPFEGGASSYLTRVLKGKGDLAGWVFSNRETQIPTRFSWIADGTLRAMRCAM
ncbi:MAG: hypothetical protein IPP78_10120 [Holophagaceae bacterium]|nr:hypothetical protein [Holophagaceae bacterium]